MRVKPCQSDGNVVDATVAHSITDFIDECVDYVLREQVDVQVGG